MAKEGIATRLEMIVERYCENKADLSNKLRQGPHAVRNWVSKGVLPSKMYDVILERSLTSARSGCVMVRVRC